MLTSVFLCSKNRLRVLHSALIQMAIIYINECMYWCIEISLILVTIGFTYNDKTKVCSAFTGNECIKGHQSYKCKKCIIASVIKKINLLYFRSSTPVNITTYSCLNIKKYLLYCKLEVTSCQTI